MEHQNPRGIRILIGVLAVIFLTIGGVWYFQQAGASPFQIGMMIRIGAILAVICLAFPQLQSLRGRAPSIVIVLGLLVIFLVAARGTQARIMVAIIVFAVSVAGALKWLSKIADNDPRKR